MSTWAKEAYVLGRQGPGTLSRKTLRRILMDPAPTNWVKWWRRGFADGLAERHMIVFAEAPRE